MNSFSKPLLAITIAVIVGFSQLSAMEELQVPVEQAEQEEKACPICFFDYLSSGEMQVLTPCCNQGQCRGCADEIFEKRHRRSYICAFCRAEINAQEFNTMIIVAQQRDWQSNPVIDDALNGVDEQGLEKCINTMAENCTDINKFLTTIRKCLNFYRPSVAAGIVKHGLAKAGIEIDNIKNHYGMTVLMIELCDWATRANKNIDVIELLLKAAGNRVWNLITVRGKFCCTVFAWAVACNYTTIVTLLLNVVGDRAQELINTYEQPGQTQSSYFQQIPASIGSSQGHTNKTFLISRPHSPEVIGEFDIPWLHDPETIIEFNRLSQAITDLPSNSRPVIQEIIIPRAGTRILPEKLSGNGINEK